MSSFDFSSRYYQRIIPALADETAQVAEMDRRRTRNRLDKLESEIQELRQEITEFRNALPAFREEMDHGEINNDSNPNPS